MHSTSSKVLNYKMVDQQGECAYLSAAAKRTRNLSLSWYLLTCSRPSVARLVSTCLPTWPR